MQYFGILDVNLHTEELTQEQKSLEVVVDIFNRINSGGTKLSKGDLALAKICADWPEARRQMQSDLKEWERHEYSVTLDWLLRCVNTVLTGEAEFHHLHGEGAGDIQEGLKRTVKWIHQSLNLIESRLGLDHDRFMFGRLAIPVMAYYMDRRGTLLGEKEPEKLLFWSKRRLYDAGYRKPEVNAVANYSASRPKIPTSRSATACPRSISRRWKKITREL